MSLDDKTDSEPTTRINKTSYDSGSLKLKRESYSGIRKNVILRMYEDMADVLRKFEEGVCQRIFNTLLR